MSDELNRGDGQHEPESHKESANNIERSDDPARVGNSLEASTKAFTNGDSNKPHGENEILAGSDSSSNPAFPLLPNAEDSNGPSNDNRWDRQDERSQDRSDSTLEPRKLTPTPPIVDTNAPQNHGDPPGQPNLDDSPFIPSPAIDVARCLDPYKKRILAVMLIEWVDSKPTLSYNLNTPDMMEFEGQQYYVPPLPPGLYESMPLPFGWRPYGSSRELFTSIQHFLHGFVMLSEEMSALLTYWCIASWFPDVLDFVPRLTITGSKYAADLLFQMLRCACRRPLLLAGLSPAVLKLIPIRELMPTLFIYESRPSKRTEELLDAGDYRGYFFASGANMHQCYCARCIYLGEGLISARSVSQGIYIHVSRNALLPERSLPSTEEIQALQNMLFIYRNFNRDRVAASRYRPTGLLPELNAVARQLGACIVENTDLQHRIPQLLREQNEQALGDRLSELKGAVLRAVLRHCHAGDGKVHTSKIADTVNATYKKEGESLRVSSESVGHALKNVGLYSTRLDSSGRGLKLDKTTQLRVHQLALAYGVLPSVPECGHCQTLQNHETEQLV
jgi:hypothetical protein